MNLGKRLQPAKRAWKILTSTIHAKFRKLNASRSIKKSKTRVKSTTKSSSLSIFQFRAYHQRKKIHKAHILRRHRLPKRSAPVYIDELFKETVVTSKVLLKEKGLSSRGLTKLAGTSPLDGVVKREKGVEGAGTSGADDMWESLQLASPLMYGINERADEFIARIKSEMHLQEIRARRL